MLFEIKPEFLLRASCGFDSRRGHQKVFGGVSLKVFNKLVRDKIPEIIVSDGKTPKIKILDNNQYVEELNKKLSEEVCEYLADGNIEELADIEEVLRALLEVKGVSYEDFDKMRENKCKVRGAFKDRIFLESTE